MKINYKKYVVFPYTTQRLQKLYTKDILNKYGDQIAFLFQNGFSFMDNSLAQIEEQMMLYNNFENTEDFEDLIKSCGKAFKFSDPTSEGYKIVDSVLQYILDNTAWALKNFINIKTMGEMYKEKIEQMLNIFGLLVDSDDIEIKRVLDAVVYDDFLYSECIEFLDNENYTVLLMKYQELYKYIYSIHKKINRALLSTSEKGKLATIGNVNDELYGSAGGYNPNNNEIITRNGSSVFELKTLQDPKLSDDDLRIKMRVIAKECIENGEDDKIIVAFAKGDNSNLSQVRKILSDVCFSGIMVLLDLKHRLTIFDDSLNKNRAENILKELTAICRYTNYKSKELV